MRSEQDANCEGGRKIVIKPFNLTEWNMAFGQLNPAVETTPDRFRAVEGITAMILRTAGL